MHTYDVEYTDTFAGVPNYCWVTRKTIHVPEWPRFKGWDGNGRIAPKGYKRELMRRAKAAVGITNMRGTISEYNGDTIEFRPYRCCTVMFITWHEEA